MLNKPADLKSLLGLTNKFYNIDPGETQNVPVKAKKQSAVNSTPKPRKRLASFDPGDTRTVTKVSPMDHPEIRDPSFDRIRMSLWEKVSKVFSSKKKAS